MKHKQQKIKPERRGNLQYQALLRCKYCGCETNEDVIKAAHWTRKGLIVIEDIPVRQCQGCGEEFFKKETAQRIQKVVTYPAAKAKQQIRVPVYSLSKVRAAARRAPCVVRRATQYAIRNTQYENEPIRANQSCQETLLCKYCGSVTVNDMVKSVLWVDGRLIAIENIPARVCQQCREQFYDDQTIEKMTTLGKRPAPIVRRTPSITKNSDLIHPHPSNWCGVPGTARRDVSVPVFSLADVKESSGKRPLLRKN